jgi:hypothetical protein
MMIKLVRLSAALLLKIDTLIDRLVGTLKMCQAFLSSHLEVKSHASHWMALAGNALMSVGVIPA